MGCVRLCTVQVLILAVPAVLWNTATIGLTARYVLPYHWDWPTSLMFGGMMSATDPVVSRATSLTHHALIGQWVVEMGSSQ